MLQKGKAKNQVSPVTPSLQAGRPANDTSFKPGHGGARAGAALEGPRGVPNKVTSTFRDVLTQAVSEIGDSQEVAAIRMLFDWLVTGGILTVTRPMRCAGPSMSSSLARPPCSPGVRYRSKSRRRWSGRSAAVFVKVFGCRPVNLACP
jgi:hypothetical protein